MARLSRHPASCQERLKEFFAVAQNCFLRAIDKRLALIKIPDDSPKTICTVTNSIQTYDVLLQTDFPDLQLFASGKVRDLYKIGNDRLLFVATDRISAFDCVLPQGIPHKGRVLTQMSLFWFDFLKDVVPNHLITAEVAAYPSPLHAFRDQLEGRSMLVKRCRMEAVECVSRGYVSGSGWKDYRNTGAICGIPLPAGLRESDRLPEPIFTPATKAQTGHDVNVSFQLRLQLSLRRQLLGKYW